MYPNTFVGGEIKQVTYELNSQNQDMSLGPIFIDNSPYGTIKGKSLTITDDMRIELFFTK